MPIESESTTEKRADDRMTRRDWQDLIWGTLFLLPVFAIIVGLAVIVWKEALR